MESYTIEITEIEPKRMLGKYSYEYKVLDSEGELFYTSIVEGSRTKLKRNEAEELVMDFVLDSLAADLEDNYEVVWIN